MSTSALFIPPAFVTHSEVYFSRNELAFTFSKSSFPEGSTFSSYVQIGSERIPLAIAPDPSGNLRVRAEFVMQNSKSFPAYPIPEGDRYAHECQPSPLQTVSLGVVSYQNAVPGFTLEESFPVLKGGIHASDFRLRGNTFLTRQKDAGLHFLSRQPLVRRVAPMEPVGLMYLANLTPLASVNVCVRMFQADTHEDQVIDTIDLKENALYYIPCDVTSLQIPDRVNHYEVYLLDPISGKRYSEVRRYSVDRRPNKRIYLFAYENSLGYYETLYFYGDDTQTEKITISDEINMAVNKERLGQRINVEGNQEITVRSGFYSPGFESAFRELLYSPDVYLITPSGKVPIVIKSDSMVLPAGDAPEYASELTFTLDSTDPFPLHQKLFFES